MDTVPLDTHALYDDDDIMSMDKLPPLPKLKSESDPTAAADASAAIPVHGADELEDVGSIHSETKLPRQITEGFIAFSKTFDDVEVTADATNPVKKDTTTSSGKVNHSPCTPLKSIANISIQLLKIDDLRMFCSKNKIKGSRKAKKAEVCWAIAQAKRQHDAGQPPPYKNPCPVIDGMDDVILRASTTALGLLSDDVLEPDEAPHLTTQSGKKRKNDAVAHLDPLHANDSGEGLLGRFDLGHSSMSGPELMALQQRIAQSIEEKNRAVQLRESMEAASLVRRDIRDERNQRAVLFAQLVEKTGDDQSAYEKVEAYKKAKVDGSVADPTILSEGSEEGILENIVAQDNIIMQLNGQYAVLSESVSKLMAHSAVV